MARYQGAANPRWIIATTFFLSGLFLGSLGSYLYFAVNVLSPVRIHPQGLAYRFINPLLASDVSSNTEGFSYDKTLEQKITGLIALQKSEEKIIDASVYFRDMEASSWFGINDEKVFAPQRLLKIPIMIAYFKLAEDNPSILTEKLVFVGPHVPQLYKPSKEPLVIGNEYTIDDLIRRMVQNGDEDAATMLFNTIDSKNIAEIFSELGIDTSSTTLIPNPITLKRYSLFWRILYNATYLNREYSEKALTILVDAPNDAGITGRLQKNILAANRYNTHEIEKGVYAFSDCSIIYFPQHPYLLCGVAEGHAVQNLDEFLGIMGETVYNEIAYKYQ